jgi:hypothetical protein
MPGEQRINAHGNLLLGEIQGSSILIFESNPTIAADTLAHEFVEYMIHKHTSSYLDIINSQKKIIERLLYREREGLVDKLSSQL